MDMLKYMYASKPKQYEYFLDELTTSLSKIVMKYENIIIMDDFNIDKKGLGCGQLDAFRDVFNLTNLIYSETYLMKNYKSTIDLFLTNKPKSFFKTHTKYITINIFLHFSNPKRQEWSEKIIFIETIKSMKRVF